MIGSAAGGMDIEEVAAHSPEKITTVDIHPAAGLQPYQCRQMAFALGFKDAQIGAVPGASRWRSTSSTSRRTRRWSR